MRAFPTDGVFLHIKVELRKIQILFPVGLAIRFSNVAILATKRIE